MIEGIKLFDGINCLDLCELLRIKLITNIIRKFKKIYLINYLFE